MTTTLVQVGEASAVPDARRAAVRCAERIGFGPHDAARIAVYATELATNLVKHGGGGDLLVQPAPGPLASAAVDLLALDTGPGMSDSARSLRRGVSTSSTAGLGLPAVLGASLEFDLYTRPGAGTAVFARIGRAGAAAPPQEALRYGAVCVAYPGEPRSGDAWAVRRNGASLDLLVVDGLGHGPGAAEAAEAAIERFQRLDDVSPERLVEGVHGAIRHTRGAAVLAATVEPPAGHVRHCGIGNVSGVIIRGDTARHLVSHNGIVGREMRRVRELTSEWPAEALLVLHTDGLRSRWQPDAWPGLWVRHPAVIAGVLFRDLRRLRDDATVVVVVDARPRPESR